MKAISWLFVVLPPVLLLMTLASVEADIGNIVAWTWIACSVGYLGWEIFISRRYQRLALACLAVGVLNIFLILLLPLIASTTMVRPNM